MRTYEERYVIKENYTLIPPQIYVTRDIIRNSVLHCYKTLNMLDKPLIENGAGFLSSIIELANLSSLVGNVLGAGYVKQCPDIYERNKPNTFPDLIPKNERYTGIEIKTAINRNCPKGHLPKEGYYLIYRYCLTDENGQCNYENRDNWNTVTIWEIRCGYLKNENFCISNTVKDSGKTAAINISSLNKLLQLYFDPYLCPYDKYKKIY